MNKNMLYYGQIRFPLVGRLRLTLEVRASLRRAAQLFGFVQLLSSEHVRGGQYSVSFVTRRRAASLDFSRFPRSHQCQNSRLLSQKIEFAELGQNPTAGLFATTWLPRTVAGRFEAGFVVPTWVSDPSYRRTYRQQCPHAVVAEF
jgi:hypothetical protein